MEYLFTPAKFCPEGLGFSLFGAVHLIWLAVLAVMCAVMVLAYRKMGVEARRKFVRWIATGLLITEIARDAWIIAAGGWEWSYLPLHPCSFTMYIMAVWAWKPNQTCAELLYGFGIVGALMALIFCNWTDQPLWQLQTLHSFLFHGILVGFILMAMIGGDLRPTRKGYWANVVFLACAAAFTAIFNNLLPDCNFFFTHEGSPGSPLELFINLFGTPWWLLAYIALAAVVIGLEFLPWKEKAQSARKRAAVE